MRKIFHDIHLWLSVPFGIIITLICFSGAMLVFEPEIMENVRKDLYFVEPQNQKPLPADSLVLCATRQLPDSVSVTGLTAYADPARAWQLSLSKPKKASAYINPYTGELTGKSQRLPFFSTMFRLHRWLLDSANPQGGIFWGKMIVGVSTIAFAFVLLSGIFIWWPRNRKALKNRLKICCNRGLKRFWYDLHVAGGMYALILLLAMALTGLTWSFSWYRSGFYTVFGVETTRRSNEQKTPQEKEKGEKKGKRNGKGSGNAAEARLHRVRKTTCQWPAVYDRLTQANPGYERIQLTDGNASVAFGGLGNQRASDRYEFDARSGEITKETRYADADKSGKIRGWIYTVHVGSWGGMLTRILTFLAALLGASLPLTGYYLWIARLIRKKQRKA